MTRGNLDHSTMPRNTTPGDHGHGRRSHFWFVLGSLAHAWSTTSHHHFHLLTQKMWFLMFLLLPRTTHEGVSSQSAAASSTTPASARLEAVACSHIALKGVVRPGFSKAAPRRPRAPHLPEQTRLSIFSNPRQKRSIPRAIEQHIASP